jgi:putative methionine-R-sulfoxide reductase with GAF domain
MSATPGGTLADPEQLIADLRRQLAECKAERDEALEQQTATAEVLQVINSSPGDFAPVLDTLVQTVARLCRADRVGMYRRRDDAYHLIASHGILEMEFIRAHPLAIDRSTLSGRVAMERRPVHIPDVLQDPEYGYEAQKIAGYRSMLGVPLLRGDQLIGHFNMTRTRVDPFTSKEIELATTFADQAVIAIENARLITETREALEQQTATAEVLGVINASPGDLAPVFDAMLEKAMRLCSGAFGILNTFDGQAFHAVAVSGVPAAFAEFRAQNPHAAKSGTAGARIIAGENIVHNVNLMDEDAYRNGDPNRRAIVDLGGARSHIAVALRKDGVLLVC